VSVVAFIQARTTSTRLPGKVNMDLGNGWTSVARTSAAAERVRGIDKVEVLWAHNFPTIPENDVLSRFYHAWLPTQATAVMRLTADCPLLDPQVCQLVLDSFLKYDVEYASNTYPKRTFPDGLDCEVFTGAMLNRAWRNATDTYDREHVTPWIQRHATCYPVVLPVDWSRVRLTLDTVADLDFLKTAIAYQRTSA
jgi:spore coat polysaccharide biosynthesis protein SpsF (cytidylyltransferase family)